MEIFPLIVALIIFLLGIAGTVLPVMPGPILIWLGMLVYGLLTGFESLSLSFYIWQGLAALLVMAVDYFATAVGTKKFGGSRIAMWGAVIGLFVGVIILGPLGLVFGPFLGALVGEMLRGLPPERAIRSSIGALVGLLGGLFVKLGIEAVMIYWFFRTLLAA